MLQTIGRTVRAIAVLAASVITLASALATPSSSTAALGSDADIHTILAARVEAMIYPPRGQHALSADRINSNQ
jgi:hypothetical protein